MAEIVNKIRQSRFVWGERQTACVVQAIHHLTDEGILVRVPKDRKNFVFQLNEKAIWNLVYWVTLDSDEGYANRFPILSELKIAYENDVNKYEIREVPNDWAIAASAVEEENPKGC